MREEDKFINHPLEDNNMGKLKNYYPYDYTELNRNYIIKVGEKTSTTPTYTLNQAEIAEIDEALQKAIEDGNLKTKDRSRWFMGFVGEKLIEKFLGLEFCDTSFDHSKDSYCHVDIEALGFGVKTIWSINGHPNNFWISNFDLNNPQLLAYVSYNHAKMCWVLDKVKLVTEFDFSGSLQNGRYLVEPKKTEILYEAPAPKRLF